MLVREAIARGATAITLEVRMSNVGRAGLYRRFGFGPVGVRKNYYQEVNEDALVMWAHEVDQPEYAALLDSIERVLPGETVDRRRATLVTLILGIETSCDETAAAVVEDGRTVCSSVVSSQVDLHARFGGVVPEVASRAHVELITPVIAEALVEAGVELAELDAVAACHGPGLAGALLVGVAAAKGLAVATGLPYVGVNHLEAHLHAAWLEDPDLVATARGADRVGRAHHDRRDGGPRPLPGGRADGRRRRRRGVRQGGASPRPRLSGRPGDRPPRPGGRSGRGARSPGRCPATPTSRSRASRPRW